MKKITLVCMLILGLGFLAATPSFKDLLIPNNGMFRIWSSNSSGQAEAEILRLTEADKSAVFGGNVSTAGSITTTGSAVFGGNVSTAGSITTTGSAVFGGNVSTAGGITATGGDAMIFNDQAGTRTLKHVAY